MYSPRTWVFFSCWKIHPVSQISVVCAEHSSSKPQLFSSHFPPNVPGQKLYEKQEASCWQSSMQCNQSTFSVVLYVNPTKALLVNVNTALELVGKETPSVKLSSANTERCSVAVRNCIPTVWNSGIVSWFWCWFYLLRLGLQFDKVHAVSLYLYYISYSSVIFTEF